MKDDYKIIEINLNQRMEAIELIHQFTRQINSIGEPSQYKILKRFPAKMVDIYFKLQGSGKILFIGLVNPTTNELLSLLLGRIEEKPFLMDEKVFFVDICVTKRGKEKLGCMTKLIEYTENWVKNKGISSIELRTLTANNAAVEYWKKRNFNPFYIQFRKTL